MKETQIVDAAVSELQYALMNVFEQFDRSSFTRILSLCHSCKGVLFFTGVGKSGIIAKKIVTTLTSFGTKAIALSAQDALHGDIGLVDTGDIVFLLSKSGETEELLHLCPPIRKKGATLVAVVSKPSCRLIQACGNSFVLPSVKELCPFDLVPTTSTLSQLIFGDVLASTLMRLKKVSLEDFIKNHPAGRIGRGESLLVHDLMRTGEKIPKAGPDDRVVDVLHELSSKECGCVFVVDQQNHLLGVFTDGDLRRSIQKYNQEVFAKTLGELMTKSARSTHPKAKAKDTIKQMEADPNHPITVLAVVDDSECLIGALKLHDLLQAGI